MNVKAGKLPGQIKEYAVEEDSTVQEVLDVAALDHTGYEIRMDGGIANLDDAVDEGAVVLLVKKVKGNDSFITVKVGQMPGEIVSIALNGERTVTAALEAAALDHTGYEIRVNGAPADPGTALNDGDTVLLVRKVKGN